MDEDQLAMLYPESYPEEKTQEERALSITNKP